MVFDQLDSVGPRDLASIQFADVKDVGSFILIRGDLGDCTLSPSRAIPLARV